MKVAYVCMYMCARACVTNVEFVFAIQSENYIVVLSFS